MGIREKKTGIIASYTATALSLVIGGWLMVNGHDNPRKYTSAMRINYHGNSGTYAAGLACRQCHEPPNSDGEDSIVDVFYLGSMITCVTSKCHGELDEGIDREEGFEIFTANNTYDSFSPGFRERYDRSYSLHSLTDGMQCIDCHSEHEEYTAPFPEGWEEPTGNQISAYKSIEVDVYSVSENEKIARWIQKL